LELLLLSLLLELQAPKSPGAERTAAMSAAERLRMFVLPIAKVGAARHSGFNVTVGKHLRDLANRAVAIKTS
jgi:hypothetical protein